MKTSGALNTISHAEGAREPGFKTGDGSIAIDVLHLTMRYGNLKAVEDLCLSVPSGRLFCLVGRNGAGKSTTIGCLVGMLDPSEGSIRLLGGEFTRAAVDLKRRIGVLPEGLALFDQLYAPEFLSFVGRMFGLSHSAIGRRVDELLAAMDLKSALDKRLSQFSTGMRKKVAFAGAIIHSPEILFLDEPFAGMDVRTVAMLKTWLRQYVAGGRTVFMTTHILETAERLCDEVAIIDVGRLVWQGDVSGLARGHPVEYQDRQFSTLEELFLHFVGAPPVQLDWF